MYTNINYHLRSYDFKIFTLQYQEKNEVETIEMTKCLTAWMTDMIPITVPNFCENPCVAYCEE